MMLVLSSPLGLGAYLPMTKKRVVF